MLETLSGYFYFFNLISIDLNLISHKTLESNYKQTCRPMRLASATPLCTKNRSGTNQNESFCVMHGQLPWFFTTCGGLYLLWLYCDGQGCIM